MRKVFAILRIRTGASFVKKRVIAILICLSCIAGLSACGKEAGLEESPDTDSWMLLVENDDLVLYNTETEAEFVIDTEFYQNGNDDASISAVSLSTLIKFTEDGRYFCYFSESGSACQLKAYDWTALCNDPGNTAPLLVVGNANPEAYQLAKDSIGYFNGQELHWYSFDLDTDWTLCDTFDIENCLFYIAEDGQTMLVSAYDEYDNPETSLFKIRTAAELHEDSYSGVLQTYTTDLSEIVILADSETCVDLITSESDGKAAQTTLLTLDEACSQGYDMDSLVVQYADARTICLNSGLGWQDGTWVSMPGSICNTDRFTHKRADHTYYGSYYSEIEASNHPIFGYYYDDGTRYVFSDSLTPFQSAASGDTFYASYDSQHSILYTISGSPKKGGAMYANTVSNGSITNETMVSSNAKFSVFDQTSGTLFYYEPEDAEANRYTYTLYCITNGDTANPQKLLNGAGCPVNDYRFHEGALQFEDNTGRILCWTEVDDDACSGAMYLLNASGTAAAAKICDQASYQSWGSLGDHIYLIQTGSGGNAGTLCVYDGNSVTECKDGVQAVITPNNHCTKALGYAYLF